MKTKTKKIINTLLLIIVTGLVLFLALKDDFDNIVREIVNINPIFLLVCILLIFGYWFFRAYVFRSFVRKFKPKYHIFNAFRLHMDTVFFDAITPFASGGQPYQIYKLKKEEDISISDSTNIVFQNFIVYQIAFLLLSAFAFIYNYIFRIYPVNPLLRGLVTLGFFLNLLVGIIMFAVAFLEKFNNFVVRFGIAILVKLNIVKDKEKKEAEWKQYIKNFHESASYLVKDKKSFLKGIFLNIIAIMALYLVPIVVFYGLGVYTGISGVETFVTAAYVTLMGSYIPLPGGTGGLEYGFLVFFGCFINEPKLTAAMIIWRFLTYYSGIIVGAIFLNIKRKKAD